MLQNGAFIINTGRGEQLIENDLIFAIEKKIVSGACLDVLSQKPLPKNHPFNSISSIKLTPHIAGYIGSDTQAPYACEVINNFFQGEEMEGLVNYDGNY